MGDDVLCYIIEHGTVCSPMTMTSLYSFSHHIIERQRSEHGLYHYHKNVILVMKALGFDRHMDGKK